MSDINVSVGLNTATALKDSQQYIKSLNDIVEISERLQKQTKLTSKAIQSQGKATNGSKTSVDSLATTINRLEKAYTPLTVKIRQLKKDNLILNKAMDAGVIGSEKAARISAALTSKYNTLTGATAKSTSATKALRKHQEALGKSMAVDRVKSFNKVQARLKLHLSDTTKAAKLARKAQEALGRAMASDRISAFSAQQKRLAKFHRDAAAAARKQTAAIDKQNASVRKGADLWGALKRAAVLYIGINTARNIIGTVQSLDSLRAGLNVVSKDSKAAADNFKFISSEAVRLGLSVTGAGKEFVKLSAAAKGTAIDGEEVRNIFTAVSESARALNLSADDVSGAFRAITQIMSKGTVQAKYFGLRIWKRIARKLL